MLENRGTDLVPSKGTGFSQNRAGKVLKPLPEPFWYQDPQKKHGS